MGVINQETSLGAPHFFICLMVDPSAIHPTVTAQNHAVTAVMAMAISYKY